MKKYISFLLIIIYFNINAQNIYGTWKFDSLEYIHCSDTIEFIGVNEFKNFTITFFNKKTYTQQLDFDKYEEMQSKITPREIKLSSERFFIDTINSNIDNYNREGEVIYKYSFVNDTTIKIKTYDNSEVDCWREFNLYKTQQRDYIPSAQIKKLIKKKLDSILGNILILRSNEDPTKTIKLSARGNLILYTDSITECKIILDKNYKVGAIGTLSDSLISFYPTIINTQINDCNGYYGKKTKTNPKFTFNSKMQTINKNNIQYFTYQKPISSKLHNASITIGWLSFMTATIIAPIISINKHLDFNKKRYFRTVTGSVAVVAVSITISNLTNRKQYLIGNKYKRNGWFIE